MGLEGTLGFLGYGNMGSAILEGLIGRQVLPAERALVYDPAPPCQEAATKAGARLAESAADLAAQSDILVLAVKPQAMGEALAEAKPGAKAETLLVSIAAGISIAFIQDAIGGTARVVRVMPNTPALVRAGAAALAPSANCVPDDVAAAKTIFESIGIAEVVEEADIDAVTALSGSGPAYFFYAVECLVKAAAAEGLDEGVATRLATQTLLGAGKLLSESGDSAAVLRQKVTSKGGTTEAALRTFGEQGFEKVIGAGVSAAAARSRELGA